MIVLVSRNTKWDEWDTGGNDWRWYDRGGNDDRLYKWYEEYVQSFDNKWE